MVYSVKHIIETGHSGKFLMCINVVNKDSKYFYYPHGPLARMETGDKKVQGTDYAYTIQGWIKGTNSDALNVGRDIGIDGILPSGGSGYAGLHSFIGRDAYNYSLGYYVGDYKAIDPNKNLTLLSFVASTTGSDLINSRNDLFNGNISHMVTNLSGLGANGMAYKYDQLNRIKQTKGFANLDAVNNVWQSSGFYFGLYQQDFTYDGNGNIETAFVKNGSIATIDNQTYHYTANTNKLDYIDDAAGTTSGFDIPSGQGSGNYVYNPNGELIADVQGEITNIYRRIDGKVRFVERSTGSKPYILIDYDAMGNRVAKNIYNNDGSVWKSAEYYIRDAQGNVLATYEASVQSDPFCAEYIEYDLTEKHMYGSSSLGIDGNKKVLSSCIISSLPTNLTLHTRGKKDYTMSNHLGNVLATVTDRRISNDNIGTPDNKTDYYTADISSLKDYGPFGEYLTGRLSNPNDYPNSFNGKRDDQELFDWQDYGFRNYMKAVRRFDRVDPITSSYPMLTPYQFASNTPIQAIDQDGLEAAMPIFGNDGGDFTSGTYEGGTPTDHTQTEEYIYNQKVVHRKIKEEGAWILRGVEPPENYQQHLDQKEFVETYFDAPVSFYHKAFGLGTVSNSSTTAEKVSDIARGAVYAKVVSVLFGAVSNSVGKLDSKSTTISDLSFVKQLGAEGEQAAGIIGPKIRIPSLTGTAKYRIPDKLTLSTLTEVKNVGHLSYTRQLKDFYLYSKQTNRQFTIFTRSNTTFSKPLQKKILSGEINIMTIPGF